MNEIAAVIAKNPQIKRLRIEGHASAEGRARHNKALSDDRARAVMTYLSDHGIAPEALVAVGFGSDRPIADETTAPAILGQCVVRAVDGLVLAPPDRNEGRATFVYEFKPTPAPAS